MHSEAAAEAEKEVKSCDGGGDSRKLQSYIDTYSMFWPLPPKPFQARKSYKSCKKLSFRQNVTLMHSSWSCENALFYLWPHHTVAKSLFSLDKIFVWEMILGTVWDCAFKTSCTGILRWYQNSKKSFSKIESHVKLVNFMVNFKIHFPWNSISVCLS